MAKGIPLTTEGNPLVSLAVAMIKAVLYVLDQVKNLVTWCTITFPRYAPYPPLSLTCYMYVTRAKELTRM